MHMNKSVPLVGKQVDKDQDCGMDTAAKRIASHLAQNHGKPSML